MPRYNHCLAALRTIEGDFESSEKHYKRSLAVNPSDVMLRNDYSLQVADVLTPLTLAPPAQSPLS